MKTNYLVKQHVETVSRGWMEVIANETSERLAKLAYTTYTQNNPDEYFELIKVSQEEECLAFTKSDS